MMSGRGLWCQGEGYGVRERAMVSVREKVKAVHLMQLPQAQDELYNSLFPQFGIFPCSFMPDCDKL